MVTSYLEEREAVLGFFKALVGAFVVFSFGRCFSILLNLLFSFFAQLFAVFVAFKAFLLTVLVLVILLVILSNQEKKSA